MDKIIIFGCGIVGQRVYNELGSLNVECFIDNNKELHGTTLFDKKIISLDTYVNENYKNDIIIAISSNHIFVKKQLDKNNISNYNFYKTTRMEIANKYLTGDGIEIGALHSPLLVTNGKVNIKYVDVLSKEDAKKKYKELDGFELVDVDIIDNGETLETIENNTLDFIILNHVIEHFVNPIQALVNAVRKLKVGGIIYMGAPNKDFTFDKERELTPFSHVFNDYENYNRENDKVHYEEWVYKVQTDKEDTLENSAYYLYETNYNIHFHVWDYDSFNEFLNETIAKVITNIKIEYIVKDTKEIISILKKID